MHVFTYLCKCKREIVSFLLLLARKENVIYAVYKGIKLLQVKLLAFVTSSAKSWAYKNPRHSALKTAKLKKRVKISFFGNFLVVETDRKCMKI